jgi:hypothetical protein
MKKYGLFVQLVYTDPWLGCHLMFESIGRTFKFYCITKQKAIMRLTNKNFMYLSDFVGVSSANVLFCLQPVCKQIALV